MDVWVLTQAYINKFFTLGYNQIYALSEFLLLGHEYLPPRMASFETNLFQ